jgi:hypothetical protein
MGKGEAEGEEEDEGGDVSQRIVVSWSPVTLCKFGDLNEEVGA